MDTYAPSYRSLAVTSAGAMAARAKVLKEEKYSDALIHSHFFTVIAVETSGVVVLGHYPLSRT